MTGEEAKKALFGKMPVRYRGVDYIRMTGIIYRYNSKMELIVSAELLDKCGHSVVIAPIKEIEII